MKELVVTRHERIGTRKATNLSLDMALVAEARALGINLSRTCEDALAKQIAAERGRRWQEENKEAIAAWNVWAENNELPLEKYRQF
ncbi:MAG: post-segregation antitoxin CcdA [Sphingobium sp.]|jgi:antitoxin CcdA|uniref:type II toxin-antitoxin system CcdA family antitoxin n=1 Tax=Sphingobium sp. TaxID=1912891 RepID=UPI0003791C5D|nr:MULTISPECIES: type II toxin-antitoxin system CcdA family antitoxin [Sphingobium]MBU0658277.1 type II toxin-antitoxin system CcdA family antitoxin [Alphaproteobacteria bacterium]MBA4754446.1 type II toxin-antitoxin system CcdA family antitoxin [Sphingobium sp.]MBS87764.1 post-segregation antitoxin CcdA [Sphingobium sp.]MBU0776235.1 type II toxin-antitoxin system CcdA family antitoxin [Alphaproteobacteria bacterium]MBU1794142.1 type II toxin-antitoxin system CcdA family antitoxin [Alphaproteo